MLPITVFTPTYNRAHLLPRVYKSLCGLDFYGPLCIPHEGENQAFEWLIVDDGSTDNTREVVENIMSKHTDPFAIRYIYKKNGGKHTAVNVGLQEAKGELFFILDSDDYLPSDALKIVAEEYAKVRDDATIGGVAGLDRFADGRTVGNGLLCDSIDCNAMDIRYKHHVTGDMKEVFRTEVLKEFPFPEIEGERFCPEDLVWNRIAKKYKLHFFNKHIYIAEYQDGGLTDNIMRIRHFSPLASMTYYQELYHVPVPLIVRIKAAINYWRFTPLRYYGKVMEMHMMNIISLCALPFGIVMRMNDKRHL